MGRRPLEGASHETLLELSGAIDGVLCSVLKVRGSYRETRAIEKRMVKVLSRAWGESANRALTAAFAAGPPSTRTKLNTFLKRLGAVLKTPLTRAQETQLLSHVTAIWKTVKRMAARAAKIEFDFAMVDRNAVAAINKHQVFWAGNFHEEHLSRRIRAVSEDVMLQRGYPAKEGGKVLQQALRREYGLATGGKSQFAPQVPARFAGRPDAYWEGVASNAAHQSRSFGQLQAFSEAEIVTYRIVNPMDDRTGQICQNMNDQVFSVDTGAAHMGRILSASDPQDVKDVAPWLSGSELEERLGGASPGSSDATSRLEAAGAILPPFHFRCRSDIEIVT